MKWKSHTSIARAIAQELALPEELERALCAGSVEPDRRPDAAYRETRAGVRIGRAPHHQPPTGTIMAYLWRSRRAYLQGNDYWAVKSLGRALHYVQDKSVSPGRRFRQHDRREEEVADVAPPREAVVEGIERAVCSPYFVRECVKAVRPLKRPEDIMYEATLYSAAIFASVVGPPDAEEAFVRQYAQARREHLLRWPVAGAIAGAAAAASLLAAQPLLVLPGAAGAAALVRLDLDYYHLRREAEWFMLDERPPRHQRFY